MFVFACSIGGIVLWCVLFRIKNGVWHMVCPFDNPPTTSLMYTTNRNIANIVPTKAERQDIEASKIKIKKMKSQGGEIEEADEAGR